WHILTNEPFQGDAPTWPWGNWTIYPNRNYFQTGPPYVWGIQDYIYKFNGTDAQALWCVGLPPSLDPEFDDYIPNTNSWVRYGPFNLSNAVAARASFWYYNVSQVVSDYVRWGGYNVDSFQMYEGGRHSGETTQWQNTSVFFDSLQGGTVSLIGEPNVWLVFHFQSNSDNDVDIGAFIDEVYIAWDDGTFDLEAGVIDFVNPDSSMHTSLAVGDTIRFEFNWVAYGSGTTPEFDITCMIDGSVFYEERRVAEIGTSQQLWEETYSDLWIVEADTHEVIWYIDSHREVEEADEDNNQSTFEAIGVPPNVPAWLHIYSPDGDTANTVFLIEWEDYDPDDNALISLYYDTDTLNFDGLPIPGAYNISEDDTTDSFLWNLTSQPNGQYWILGLIMDSEDFSWVYSDGPLLVDHLGVSNSQGGSLITDFNIEGVYPNPFNSSANISFALPTDGLVQIRIFDALGRLQAEPYKGLMRSGQHEISWSPQDLSSGLYLVEINHEGVVQMTKALYLK
ncbi:MAG: T9SS type A sorting domain-containing protein, partial [bacterium]